MNHLKLGAIYTAEAAMQLAIDLAYLGANQVSPNPQVGAVVLDKSYKLIGYGYHEKFGSAHAEVNAFKNIAKEQINGSHVFVTLEPCCHQGKTPPCADYLASMPIESLTVGMKDPNPKVAGQGIERLKQAGIKVYDYQGDRSRIEDLLDSFVFHLEDLKRPFYVVKVAASLDGLVRDGFGNSKWITTEEAREHVHFMRSRFHAILVGKNTVLQDDPLLNVRHKNFKQHKNKILVMNPSADLVPKIKDLKLYQIRQANEIYIILDKKYLSKFSVHNIDTNLYLDENSGVHFIALDFSNGVPLKDLSDLLYANAIYDVLIEGGARLHSYFLEHKAFDRLYYYQANKILGGKQALTWTSGFRLAVETPLNLSLLRRHDFNNETLMVFK